MLTSSSSGSKSSSCSSSVASFAGAPSKPSTFSAPSIHFVYSEMTAPPSAPPSGAWPPSGAAPSGMTPSDAGAVVVVVVVAAASDFSAAFSNFFRICSACGGVSGPVFGTPRNRARTACDGSVREKRGELLDPSLRLSRHAFRCGNRCCSRHAPAPAGSARVFRSDRTALCNSHVRVPPTVCQLAAHLHRLLERTAKGERDLLSEHRQALTFGVFTTRRGNGLRLCNRRQCKRLAETAMLEGGGHTTRPNLGLAEIRQWVRAGQTKSDTVGSLPGSIPPNTTHPHRSVQHRACSRADPNCITSAALVLGAADAMRNGTRSYCAQIVAEWRERRVNGHLSGTP